MIDYEKPSHTNRLINQKSPYLLQHAHNPVDWYPWGDEAFRAARDQDKPIFLSVGYATCHWCHVMERESFEDSRIAEQMNKSFINIKVDREELPEVDSLYMEFAQGMMSGAAGWPLNVILTPELQPFFAATYLPPNSKNGLIGLMELIARINDVWQGEERESVLAQAAQVVEVFAENVHVQGDELPIKEQIEDVADQLFKMADSTYGGMKGMPKFPIGYQYNFLLRYWFKNEDSRALFLVERSLDMMHRGGIYDHLGGGFSRYSVDDKWLIPHFEKMLYDNALLANAYCEAWLATKNPLYREICEDILNYVLVEMTHPDGGFYSAQDAESEGHEGLFYTWKVAEIRSILGEENSKLFCEFYGVTEAGNFEGRNVLHTPIRLEEFAKSKSLNPVQLKIELKKARQLLFAERDKRIHPFKDDKILSSWNGLMIYSLAEAGRVFNEPRYLEAALKAAQFIRKNMWQEGQLLRRWREGEAMYHAGLDEYAFLIRGLISLFEMDRGSEWLEWAMEMTQILQEKFKAEGGAFYQTDGEDSNIILRKCQFADGAEPSGNAVHGENLQRLYQLTFDRNYLEQARDILKAAKKYIDTYGPGYCYHMMNLNWYYDKHSPSLVIALNEKEEHLKKIQELIYSRYTPHKSVIWRRLNDVALFSIVPIMREQKPLEGKTTLSICHEGSCQRPLTDLADIQAALEKI